MNTRQDPRTLILEWAVDVRPAAVSWAWQGRVPLGSLTLLVGQPGLGKSMLACDLAARASQGRLEGDFAGPSDVLYLSAEDSPEHTLVPRLVAASADLERVHFVLLRDEAGDRSLTLPDDVDMLREAISATDARLVIIDPVMAHLATALDVHRDHSIRRALAPLAQLADEVGVAMLAVAHLNKAAGSDLFARVGGSIGLTAAARSVLVMAPDPQAGDGSPERILAHGKSNLSPLAPALRVRVEGRTAETDHGPIATAGLAWLGEAPGLYVADLLVAPEGRRVDRSTARGRAEKFLRAVLADGPRDADAVAALAEQAGIASRTLDRAKGDLEIIAVHEGQPGTPQRWTWELPPKGANDDPRTRTLGLGALGDDVAPLAEEDPQGEGWMRARLPELDGGEETTWIA